LGAGYGISCFADHVALESANAIIAESKATAHRSLRRRHQPSHDVSSVLADTGISLAKVSEWADHTGVWLEMSPKEEGR
jgi:hypothetical protein